MRDIIINTKFHYIGLGGFKSVQFIENRISLNIISECISTDVSFILEYVKINNPDKYVKVEYEIFKRIL